MKDLAPPSVIFVLMSHSLEIVIFDEILKLRFKKMSICNQFSLAPGALLLNIALPPAEGGQEEADRQGPDYVDVILRPGPELS